MKIPPSQVFSVLFCHQDGDFSTSWTCTGDPREPDDDGSIYYECEVNIGLVHFRHIKQVKIGESVFDTFVMLPNCALAFLRQGLFVEILVHPDEKYRESAGQPN